MAKGFQFIWKDRKAMRLFSRLAKSLSGAKRAQIINAVGLYWKRVAIQTFKAEGARAGLAAWPERSPATEKTFHGTWKLAYGTDQYPRRTRSQLDAYRGQLMRAGKWRVGKTGPMPGYTRNRRYDRRFKILQVSGHLRKVFATAIPFRDRVIVGAPRALLTGRGRWTKTEKIISGRPVFTITGKEKKQMVSTVIRAIKKAAMGA